MNEEEKPWGHHRREREAERITCNVARAVPLHAVCPSLSLSLDTFRCGSYIFTRQFEDCELFLLLLLLIYGPGDFTSRFSTWRLLTLLRVVCILLLLLLLLYLLLLLTSVCISRADYWAVSSQKNIQVGGKNLTCRGEPSFFDFTARNLSFLDFWQRTGMTIVTSVRRVKVCEIHHLFLSLAYNSFPR